MTWPWAYISVGANLGDPLMNCRQGINRLCKDPAINLLACSNFYRTEPVDYIDQNWFVNAAIKIETGLAPFELLNRIQAVQQSMGRKQDAIRYGPRVLDMDIILFQDVVLKTDRLTIPHPRMHKRRFVLQPICDIDATVVHPLLQKDAQTLLKQLVTDGQEIVRCSSNC